MENRAIHRLALTALFISCAASHASSTELGILEIYDMATQNGTVARRVVSDEQKRPVRETYYRAKSFSLSVKDESEIAPYLIRLICYDASSRRVWEEEYTPEWKLERTLETLYTGTIRSSLSFRNAEGILQYEVRSIDDRGQAHLYYDDSGKHIHSLRGPMPTDIDLPAGWGKQVDGLACGIGTNHSAGKLQDICIYATVRNFTAAPRNMITCLPTREIQISLRDAAGKLIPQAADSIRLRDKELQRMNGGTNESRQNLGPHEAACFNGGYDLKDWYANLPPGSYTLSVKRRGDGPGFTLASNPIQIEILPD